MFSVPVYIFKSLGAHGTDTMYVKILSLYRFLGDVDFIFSIMKSNTIRYYKNSNSKYVLLIVSWVAKSAF